jgi:GTP cyclohydrolase I
MKNQKLVEESIKNILNNIGEDITREGLVDTPKRVFNSHKELFCGYELDVHNVLKSALFSTDNKEMVIVKDIEFYSMCEHHMLPMFGSAVVAYIPDGKVVGLSKIPRVVDIYARRLQIQEQLTEQIASAIDDVINPIGVAVVLKARHMCMEMRGITKTNSQTITSSYRGEFLTNRELKAEFLGFLTDR